MRRGEVWTVSDGGDYGGKPRPVVIVQDDAFDALASVTVCPFTSDPADLPLFRVKVSPEPGNGLKLESRIMADKITTVHKSKLGMRVGMLSGEDMRRLGQALVVFIGLAR
ncbi:type II toxin-antitoxin system PemK/MazF family toxin [Shinella sp. BYT-45]|uniref:type II toxin-antitoxin system PemK/MazF family toxin n=1 Tax=Shinella sp. BYT-45 TaxID=3377377 RepID=UPI00397FA63A